MNYGEIKKCDIANGEGVRVSLFVSGCSHGCKGCFNEVAWDFSYGEPFTGLAQEAIMDALSHEYIDGLSLLGGEPLEPQNQRALAPFLKAVKARFPDKSIWCYTGYTLESDLLEESRARTQCTDEILQMIDVLVDGEFVEALKDIRLPFAGSSNQRMIDMAETRRRNKVCLLKLKSAKI